jgi:hypothetical protein
LFGGVLPAVYIPVSFSNFKKKGGGRGVGLGPILAVIPQEGKKKVTDLHLSLIYDTIKVTDFPAKTRPTVFR